MQHLKLPDQDLSLQDLEFLGNHIITLFFIIRE